MRYLPLALCLLIVQPIFSQTPDRTIAIVQNGKVEIVKLAAAQEEYERLRTLPTLTQTQYARFVALTISLGTDVLGCTKEQEFALLCVRELGGR
jgi:hypothetical protein